MMGGLARWASAHTGAVVLVAIVLAFVTAGSVARCQAIHAPSDAEDAQSPENLAEEELPDEMRALRKTYTDVTKEALGMLAANAWADGQGTAVVTFTDRAIRTTTQGGEEWEAYAVSASARKSVTDEGAASAVTTLCLGTSEWTDIATLTVPQGGDAGAYATFQCPSVCGGSALTLSPALKEVALDGPDDAVLEARGTTREAAEAAMAEWCALWRPTATTATWTRVVEEDHGERTHRLFFELDDQRASNVTLVVGMDDGSLSVEEGGR